MIPRCVGVPVLAVTAHAMVGDKDCVLAAGFDGYISKPVQMETLPLEIAKCLPEKK